jgi:putative ABC transport system permease protein
MTAMVRLELLREVVGMAFETLRANKLRSGLTIVGVVIGVTAVVGMTSLVRGFDQSLQAILQSIGPTTLYVAKFSGMSFMSGKSFLDLLKRPNLSREDARAIEKLDGIVAHVDVMYGGGFRPQMERIAYGRGSTKSMPVIGASESFAEVNRVPMAMGRSFTESEVNHRRSVVILGDAPYRALFRHVDPLGKQVRIGDGRYTVVGVLGKRPSPGGFDIGQDEFAVLPFTSYARQYGMRPRRVHGQEHLDVTIVVVPKDGVSREVAVREVEKVMRIRHGLRLEEENDFDIITQESAAKVMQQVTSATLLAVVALSSIALLVGGIGVMAIMTISVTERTREIGLRKALGARRREILLQFLLEAAALTTLGGIVGVVLGSGTGLVMHWISGFPISLPWWSFVLGLGFSAGVGLVFGMLPAMKASRLDPIEALHHE